MKNNELKLTKQQEDFIKSLELQGKTVRIFTNKNAGKTCEIIDDLKRQLAEAQEVIKKQHEAYEYLITDISKRLDFGMPLKIKRDEKGILYPWGHGVVIGLDQANEAARQLLKKGEAKNG